MKDWLKRVIRKGGHDGANALVFIPTNVIWATVLSLDIPRLTHFLSSFGAKGLIFTLFISCIASGPLVRWANSDDDQISPPDQKLLMYNAFQEIEDYLSGKSLIEEIEKLRNRFVARLYSLSSQLAPFLRATQARSCFLFHHVLQWSEFTTPTI